MTRTQDLAARIKRNIAWLAALGLSCNFGFGTPNNKLYAFEIR